MRERIARAAAEPRVAVAACGLRRLFALCCLADSMISIDTGPAHAAAALCLPLVVLYGVQSARVWLPRSGGQSPVLPLESPHVSQISAAQVIERWRSLPPAGDPDRRGCGEDRG